MSRDWKLVTVIVVCASLVAMAAGSLHAQAAKQTAELAAYAGTWVFDAKASDGPEKAQGEDGRGGGPPGGGVSGGFMGFGGSGGPPDRAKVARLRRITEAELKPPQKVVVAVDGAQLTVTVDDERPETIVPDGKKHLRLTGDGEINTTTRWVEGQLVSERHYDEGMKATRTYRIEAPAGSPRQLVVRLRFEGGHAPRLPEIKDVYTAQ